jgi:acyl-CoA synthetase (AMP-forming)/AMP-acid ligase II
LSFDLQQLSFGPGQRPGFRFIADGLNLIHGYGRCDMPPVIPNVAENGGEVKGYLTPGYAGSSAGFNSTTFSADGYFKTGDLGSLNEPGWLTFTGRSSELIKRSGINVSPAEVEEILQQHPAVALAGVTGVADTQRGEIIVAYVILKADAVSDSEQLIAHCRDHLSRYKIPERIFITDALPLTATGKLMRRELKAQATARINR